MKNMMIAAVLAAAGAGAAQAGFYVETEPNNTLAQANFVGNYTFPGDAFLVDGNITRADEDWFVFTVTDATQIRASTFGRPDSNLGDSLLYLFDSNGNQLAFDDDSGVNLFSSLEYNTTGGGTFYLKVASFQGASSFDYKLVVGLNVVPTPGPLALAGLGALVALRRRR